MKTLKQKLEDWFAIMAYAGSAEPETGFRFTGYRASWLKSFAKNRKNIVKSDEISTVPLENMETDDRLAAPDGGTDIQKQIVDVMLVDDEPIVGKRLKSALTKHGYAVEVFENPLKAIERFSEKEFDVVVTDLRMENLNGIQFLEQVTAKSTRTKVIFITGYATVETAREALVKGAFDFIAKPFKPSDLRMAISKAASALGYRG